MVVIKNWVIVAFALLFINPLCGLGRTDKFVNLTNVPVEVVASYPGFACESDRFVLAPHGQANSVKTIDAVLCNLAKVTAHFKDNLMNPQAATTTNVLEKDVNDYPYSLVVEFHRAPEGFYFIQVLRKNSLPLVKSIVKEVTDKEMSQA